MRITLELLRELGACAAGVDSFRRFLGSRKHILPTRRNLILARAAGLDVWWAIAHGLVPRDVALTEPMWAYRYARHVDQCPRDDTRKAVLSDPCYTYRYAHDVDRRPRDDTRAAVLSSPALAYRYACDVDRTPSPPGWSRS